MTLLFGDKNYTLAYFNLSLCELMLLAIVRSIARSDLFEGQKFNPSAAKRQPSRLTLSNFSQRGITGDVMDRKWSLLSM